MFQSLPLFTFLKAKFRRKKNMIQTNAFIIFTCPNPVLLVISFRPVGYQEDSCLLLLDYN